MQRVERLRGLRKEVHRATCVGALLSLRLQTRRLGASMLISDKALAQLREMHNRDNPPISEEEHKERVKRISARYLELSEWLDEGCIGSQADAPPPAPKECGCGCVATAGRFCAECAGIAAC